MQIDIIDHAPAWMQPSERLLLYALVYGLRPRCVLEIGTLAGGSSLIICSAMDAVVGEDPSYQGKLIALDPDFKVAAEHQAVLARRTTFLTGCSPEALPQARSVAGQPFDMVLIDAVHEADFVTREIEGVLPYLDQQSYLLFHDAHYPGVHQAIENALKRYPFLDCGMLAVDSNPRRQSPESTEVVYCGLRLLRWVQPHSEKPSVSKTRLATTLLRLAKRWGRVASR